MNAIVIAPITLPHTQGLLRLRLLTPHKQWWVSLLATPHPGHPNQIGRCCVWLQTKPSMQHGCAACPPSRHQTSGNKLAAPINIGSGMVPAMQSSGGI